MFPVAIIIFLLINIKLLVVYNQELKIPFRRSASSCLWILEAPTAVAADAVLPK
jgi:hypothetical protein